MPRSEHHFTKVTYLLIAFSETNNTLKSHLTCLICFLSGKLLNVYCDSKLYTYLKLISYIRYVSKDAVKRVGWFYRSIFTSDRTDQKLSLIVLSWLEIPSPHLSVDRVQKRSCGHVIDELYSTIRPHFHRLNVVDHSLLYYLFYSKSSDKLHLLFSLPMNCNTEIDHATYIGGTHLIPFIFPW